jgi:hypothetical protein
VIQILTDPRAMLLIDGSAVPLPEGWRARQHSDGFVWVCRIVGTPENGQRYAVIVQPDDTAARVLRRIEFGNLWLAAWLAEHPEVAPT